MNKIILATGNNTSFKELLGFANVIIETIPDFPGSIYGSAFSASSSGALLIFEVNNRNIDGIISFFHAHRLESFKLFCIYPEFDGFNRQSLIDIGICDLTSRTDPEFVAECLRAVYFSTTASVRGTVHIMSDTNSFLGIVETIVRRFFYTVKIVGSIGALMELSEKETPELFLVDMDTRGFDNIEFVKRASACSSIKKAPLVLYKDMRNGLFVHDVAPGLKRLTKVILSREELLNLLITLFFLTEIGTPARIFNTLIQNSDLSVGKSFREIFYAGGPDLCYRSSFFSPSQFGTLEETSEKIAHLLKRTEPLRWLITPLDNSPTCAMGVEASRGGRR